MVEVIRSRVFARWLDGLRDRRAAARIIVRVERLGSVISATTNRSAAV